MSAMMQHMMEQGGVASREDSAAGVAHFGDPEGELEQLQQGAGLLLPQNIVMLRLDGDDAQRFCNSMFTNNFRDMVPGDWKHTAITDNKGRVQALAVGMMLAPARFLLVFDGADAEWAHDRLDMYIIMDPIELTPLHQDHTLLHVAGPMAREIVRNAGLALQDGVGEQDGRVLCPCDRLGVDGVDCIVPTAQAVEIWEALRGAGAHPVGWQASETQRIHAGLPRAPQDLGERAFPHELGLRERICSFTKGCYMGQEVINRMDTMGRLNRRLVGVQLSAPAQAGVEVLVDDKVIGRLSSVSTVGEPVGIGILRGPAWEVGAIVQVDSKPAESLGTLVQAAIAPPKT